MYWLLITFHIELSDNLEKLSFLFPDHYPSLRLRSSRQSNSHTTFWSTWIWTLALTSRWHGFKKAVENGIVDATFSCFYAVG